MVVLEHLWEPFPIKRTFQACANRTVVCEAFSDTRQGLRPGWLWLRQGSYAGMGPGWGRDKHILHTVDPAPLSEEPSWQ